MNIYVRTRIYEYVYVDNNTNKCIIFELHHDACIPGRYTLFPSTLRRIAIHRYTQEYINMYTYMHIHIFLHIYIHVHI